MHVRTVWCLRKIDMGFRPIVKYAYNVNTSKQSLASSPTASVLDDILTDKEKNKGTEENTISKEKGEEDEILMQIRKYCFPDLSDLIQKYIAVATNPKAQDKYYQVLFQHPMQSEKFDFVLTKPGVQRLYGHCRRVYTIEGGE
ncbi:hypothetical protein RFI_27727 [Reticulomyxa filosa]|uniref:Uncharacterized protein n=1 Tax=Reticulomyxa filosa TaxID=46433 RepID=X6M6V3_RETFI|nr:hypothetical protein RFI_27727 [Reticulomyxa filosa]|eukprot:ETO09649.1 hypothetical protein RFI_27727 [Reticulomyxa filosa]